VIRGGAVRASVAGAFLNTMKACLHGKDHLAVEEAKAAPRAAGGPAASRRSLICGTDVHIAREYPASRLISATSRSA
jgi:hypothetical protein